MISWKKVVNFGAISYAVVCILTALLLPSWLNFPLDNLLFPLAFIHFISVIKLRNELRLMLGSFIVLFLIGVLSELINQQGVVFSHILTLLLILKVPVLITAFLENEFVNFRSFKIERVIDSIFIILLALNLFMAIDPFGLGFSLQEFYVPKSFTNLVYYNEWGTFRLSGVFSNPNNNALVFSIFFIYYAFFRKDFWYFAVLAMLILPLTQSRTVFIALMVIGIFVLVNRFNWRGLKRFWYLLPLLAIIVTGIVYSSANLRSLFNLNAFTSNSFLLRISNFEKFTESGSNIWYGGGVIEDPKSAFDIFFDSEFIAVLFQYGIIGLIGLSLIFIRLFSCNYLTAYRREWRYLIILILIVSMTNTSFLNVQTNVVLGVFLGLILFKDSEMITPRKNPVTAPR